MRCMAFVLLSLAKVKQGKLIFCEAMVKRRYAE